MRCTTGESAGKSRDLQESDELFTLGSGGATSEPAPRLIDVRYYSQGALLVC
jgi:hypothetical protein